MMLLPQVRKRLSRHPLDDQILVYDPEEDRVHLLDQTTADVLDWLERGETADAIVAKLEQRTAVGAAAELLELALEELANAELVETSAHREKFQPEVSRREVLRKFAALGAAAVVPVIVSLTPSTALGQASFGCGAACTTTLQCPGTTRITCHCCHIGGNTAGTCSTELSGNCQNP